MFINTKNNTLAAIISLSLLMASMPVKAEENTAKTSVKKIARCAWHLAKIVTGIFAFQAASNLKQSFVEQKEVVDLGMNVLGKVQVNLSGESYFPNLRNHPSNDEKSKLSNAAQKQKENEQTVNSNLFLVKTLSLALIISGGIGLTQECGLIKNEAKENNTNKSIENG